MPLLRVAAMPLCNQRPGRSAWVTAGMPLLAVRCELFLAEERREREARRAERGEERGERRDKREERGEGGERREERGERRVER